MTPQEIIAKLQLNTDQPPWDGEIKAIHATVLANRQPVRVRVLEVYAYCGRQKAIVQALRGHPFPETNAWYHPWYSDQQRTHLVMLREVTLVY